MPGVSAAVEIARPPEDAFAVVADPERRRRLLPDNFRDVQIVSETASGPGTVMRFTIAMPGKDHTSEVEVTAWEPPHSLTERARGDSPYTMRWSFEPAPEGARVSVRMEYESSGSVFHRLVERWFGRRALEQSLMVELLRLKQTLEADE